MGEALRFSIQLRLLSCWCRLIFVSMQLIGIALDDVRLYSIGRWSKRGYECGDVFIKAWRDGNDSDGD